MFQCLKNIIVYLVCVCLIFKKLKTRYKFNIYYLMREKKSAYITVALILLPLFLLFPFSTLKLLIPSSLSKTKPTPSHSSSPSTQTKIQDGLHFPSDLISTVSNPRPSNEEGFACCQSQGKKVPLQH